MSEQGNGHRVVITGMGAITPLGNSVDEYWQNLVNGESGIGPITVVDPGPYPAKFSGDIKDFEPQDYMDRKDARRMARFSQYAVAATRQAVEDSGLGESGIDPERLGVSMGNGFGGLPNTDEAVRKIVEKGGMRIDPFFMLKVLPNMAAAHVTLNFNAKGPSTTITTACAAATQAMGHATEMIRRGKVDAVLSGGTEAGHCELGLASFSVMKVLSTHYEDPKKASRPFDAKRDGFVSAEGSAMFTLESLEHAQERGVHIDAEIICAAASADAYHMVAP